MSVQPVDRDSPLPLWAQVEADLRRRLEAGEFDDGAFPTDLELTKSYDVSRHTVREAVRELNSTGLLIRQRGRGTVVNRAEFEQSLGALYSLFESVESKGVDQTSEVLEAGMVTDTAAAARLGLPADAELFLLARIRSAGGSPLAVDRAWLPAHIGAFLMDVDWTHTALYAELAAARQPVPEQGWERLTPLVPSAPDRQRLGLKKADAAFFLERLGTSGGEPVEWRTTIIRGDRYRFVTEWAAGSISGLRPTTDLDD